MTVISLDIRSGTDPLGSSLVTLTDEDVESFEMRVSENSLGSGTIVIRRDHPAATAANLAADNYVVVTIPAIDDDPLFGFWLEHHEDAVVKKDEEGAETLTRQGPGSLAIIGRAAFLDEHYAPAPPASDDRGSANEVPGYWRWQHKQYGQIFVRLLEEGQNQPGTPLEAVTFDFDRTDDSDGTDWPAIDRDVRFEIGTDGLTFMDRFAETGEVFITCTPGLLVQARQARGVNRTSSTFASGKVRLVKGVNIQTELVRQGDTSLAATHAIVVGMENTFVQVVSPSYVPGTPGKWLRVDYDNSNDEGVLAKVGLEALARGFQDLQAITMEIRAGDDQAAGRYLPFKHFNVSDLITVHTGTDPNDYNNQAERVRAFTIALREASDDTAKGDITGDEMAARSLIVGVECGGASGSFGVNIDVTVKEKGCGGCPEPPPFDCDPTDLTVKTSGGSDVMECIFSGHGNGQGCLSSDDPADMMYLYGGATYRIDYLVFHAADSNGLSAGLYQYGGSLLGATGAPFVGTGTGSVIYMGDKACHCSFGPPSDIPAASVEWTADIDGYVRANLGEGSCLAGDSYSSSVSARVTYVSGPDPRFEGADPCTNGTPVSGGEVRETFTAPDATTSYATVGPLPYKPGSMRIQVGGLDWTPSLTETNPTTGTYDLDYAPHVGATVRIWFSAP